MLLAGIRSNPWSGQGSTPHLGRRVRQVATERTRHIQQDQVGIRRRPLGLPAEPFRLILALWECVGSRLRRGQEFCLRRNEDFRSFVPAGAGTDYASSRLRAEFLGKERC